MQCGRYYDKGWNRRWMRAGYGLVEEDRRGAWGVGSWVGKVGMNGKKIGNS